MITYTSKQDVINKGIVKKGGRIYKKSVLEIWYSKGYLEFESSKYSARQRLDCGLRLALDFHIISRPNLHSGYISDTKIDYSGNNKSVSFLDAQHRYNQVIKNIPAEFWSIVRKVCIEDAEPDFSKALSMRQKSYLAYLCRTDLCRGLDRAIDVYTKRLKN